MAAYSCEDAATTTNNGKLHHAISSMKVLASEVLQFSCRHRVSLGMHMNHTCRPLIPATLESVRFALAVAFVISRLQSISSRKPRPPVLIRAGAGITV